MGHAITVGLLLLCATGAPPPKKQARTMVLDVDVGALDKPGSKKVLFQLKKGQSFPLLKSDGTWCSLGAGGLGPGWVHCAKGHLLKISEPRGEVPDKLPLMQSLTRLEIDPARPRLYAADVDTDAMSRLHGQQIAFHAERAATFPLLEQSEDLIWCKIANPEKITGWVRCDRLHLPPVP